MARAEGEHTMQPSVTIAPGQQHMLALRRANEVRLARAELKRRIAEGDISACDIVLDVPEEAEGMTVMCLLMSQHRWGRTRCRKFLAAVLIPENKPLGSLTERQRRALVALLQAGERHGRAPRAARVPEAVGARA
jgi:hypothetical protein